MSSTYNGNASGFNPATGAAVTIPSDGDSASASSVNNPGPFEHLTDAVEWFRQNAGRIGATNTWSALQTFSGGAAITGGSPVFPAKAHGTDSSSGAQKLGYWIDAEGDMHVQGLAVSMGSSTPNVVWAASTIPSQFRPPGIYARTFLCQGSGGKVGIVNVMPDGSMSVVNIDGTSAASAYFDFVILKNSYTGYVP